MEAGAKILAGVGFEGHDAQGAVRAGKGDDMLMAQMNAVEIAHRDRRAAVGQADVFVAEMALHRAPFTGPAARLSVELAAGRHDQRFALQDDGITDGAVGFKGHAAAAVVDGQSPSPRHRPCRRDGRGP